MMEVISGSEAQPCPTTDQRRLMKTSPLRSKTPPSLLTGKSLNPCQLHCYNVHAAHRSEGDSHYTYCMADIDVLSDKLGIPWEKTKDIPFSTAVPFIGFIWDLTM